MLTFKGVHAEIIADTTLERDVEGALSSGKTICAMFCELNALRDEPGIWILMARWTGDATDTLLRPQFEQVARLHGSGGWEWDDKKKFYEWPNGSRAFSFGLKTQSQDPEERYGKIRGLPVSRIYVSQAEQIPEDIASELRSRMRPDIEAQARGDRYRRQLTFDANPVDDDTGPSGHWLARQFPVDNHIKGRKYFRVSLYANAHNLPADFIAQQEATYPPEHPKFKTMILGERGLAVTGDPIFETLFVHKTHVRALRADDGQALLEAFEVGKHNPCWMLAQRTSAGALRCLGGILAQGLVIEDFLPLVQQYRAEWYPNLPPGSLRSCIAPMGESNRDTSQVRMTLIQTLRQARVRVQWRDNANAPDVQLAMIEYLAGLLRRRTATSEECFGINADPNRWLTASRDGVKPLPFLAYAFEGGYTWSKNFVSVSHKQLRQPTEDDKYANAMHCAENIALNFCAGVPTEDDRERQRQRARQDGDGGPSVQSSGPNSWMSS